VNATLEDETCIEEGLVNAICKSGECVGTPDGCMTSTGQQACNPCEKCVGTGEDANCEPNPAMDDEPCMDHQGGTGTCYQGDCQPAFQILDQIVVQFGLQQSNPQENKADVTLGGIVRIFEPWHLVDNPQMIVVSDFPVEGPGTFEITDDTDCQGNPGDFYCTQHWEVKFTVEKICDVQTKYALQFLGKNRLRMERDPSTYWYEVTIAQKAVCGVVIRDVPLKGGIDICVDSDCTGPTNERVFRLGSEVFFHSWYSGLAPIEYFDCTEMHLQIASENPRYVITEPPDPQKPIDQGLVDAVGGVNPVKKYFQPLDVWTTEAADGATMTWSIIMANSHFAVTVAEFFKVSLDVKVKYLQGRRALSDGVEIEPEAEYYYYFMEKEVKSGGVPTGEIVSRPYMYSPMYRRYLQTPEEEFNYQFDHQFTVVPFRCTSEIDAWGVEVGSYAATPCPNGENLFMRYCDINGWNDELNKNLCNEVIISGGTVTEEPVETEGDMIWLLIIVNACAFILICSICFLICDRYKRKRARVKVVAMPDNAKLRNKKPTRGSEAKEGSSTTRKPAVAAEVAVKTRDSKKKTTNGDKKKPVEHAQLFE